MGKKRTQIFFDFETRSTVDLGKEGLDIYARHPSTEVLCMAWAVDDAEPELWVIGDPPPTDLFLLLADGAEMIAHNFSFEFSIWNLVLVLRFGWPPLPLSQGYCTMAMAYAMALPGSLDNASRALGISDGKDMEGHRVMQQVSQPRDFNPDGSPIWWEEKAAKDDKDLEKIKEKFKKLHLYCLKDVKVERQVFKRLLPLSENERKIWLIDQKINLRGVCIDIPTVKKAISLVEFEKAVMTKELREITENRVSTPQAVAQLKAFLEDYGVVVPSLAKQDVTDLLGEVEMPEVCKRALLIRQMSAKSSTAKFASMLKSTSPDGRVRGNFQYHGAGTGRWAGRRLQLHNLPRPKLKQAEIEKIFELLGRIA